MWRIVGLCGVAALVVVLALNGAFMLVSPRAWFRLPKWVGLHGSLTEARYAKGWGAIQTRLTGAIVLAVIVWALCDSLLR